MLPSALASRPTLTMLDTLRTCTEDVFATMVGMPVVAGSPVESPAVRPQGHVVGQIGFGGSRTGLVLVHVSFDGAATITRALLGLGDGDEPSRPEIADAIGEITNMVAGSFRTRMAADGSEPWVISIPTITMGTDFSLMPADGHCTLLPFRMGSHDVSIELIVTPQRTR